MLKIGKFRSIPAGGKTVSCVTGTSASSGQASHPAPCVGQRKIRRSAGSGCAEEGNASAFQVGEGMARVCRSGRPRWVGQAVGEYGQERHQEV